MIKTKQPFISVIIPTLNEEKYLPRLLKDLSEQTTDNFEVIHVDGHSDDKTKKVANVYKHKLPHFTQLNCEVRHVSVQRNMGAAIAQAPYFLFLDADTQLPPYFIEGLSYQLHRRTSDVFTTWAIPDSTETADLAIITIINLGINLSEVFKSPIAVGVCLGCTRKVFKAVGGFRSDVAFGEDEDFAKAAIKLGYCFHMYQQPRFVYSFRRFRKEGTLPTMRQIAVKKVKEYTHGIFSPKPPDYLMGGHHDYDADRPVNPYNPLEISLKNTSLAKAKKTITELLTLEKIESDL